MNEIGYSIGGSSELQALVAKRKEALLKQYGSGRLSERGEAELRGYLGGRLPHEPEEKRQEARPAEQAEEIARPVAVASQASEPDQQLDRSAWLLRRWLHRAADASELQELRALFPHAPNLVGYLTRNSYKKPLIEYARALGYKADATLKRWIDDGRACDPPDLPPFDQPDQLSVWWSRVKKRKVPSELLVIAPAAAGQAAAASPAAASGQAVAAGESRPLPGGTGFGATLERARENERQAAEALVDARKKGEPGAIRLCEDAYHKASQHLLRIESGAADILTAQQEMVRWPEVEADMIEKLNVINQAVRSIFTRIATKVTVPPDLFRALQRAYQEELDRVFEELDASDYRRAVPSPPAAPAGEPFSLAA